MRAPALTGSTMISRFEYSRSTVFCSLWLEPILRLPQLNSTQLNSQEELWIAKKNQLAKSNLKIALHSNRQQRLCFLKQLQQGTIDSIMCMSKNYSLGSSGDRGKKAVSAFWLLPLPAWKAENWHISDFKLMKHSDSRRVTVRIGSFWLHYYKVSEAGAVIYIMNDLE